LEYIPYKDRDLDSVKVKAQQYLDNVILRFAEVKATLKTQVRVGDAAREIINLAGEKECSLIAMASHGHSGIEAWIHGSVTYKVLQASNRSVMLVPLAGRD